MIDLYLTSRMDRGTWLRSKLEGSLPGLRVSGDVLEGRKSVEWARYAVDLEVLRGRFTEERYKTPLDYDAVLRNHSGTK